jgi:GT2 family glycosyltransferase
MTSDNYQMASGGLRQELELLDDQEVHDHLRNYIQNFLLDASVAVGYINRLSQSVDPNNARGMSVLSYLTSKFATFEPFDQAGLEIALLFNKDAVLRSRIACLKACNANNSWRERVDKFLDMQKPESALAMMRTLLDDAPRNIVLADKFLWLGVKAGLKPIKKLLDLEVPEEHRECWQRRLFQAYASLNAVEPALDIWSRLDKTNCDENTLNLAAEVLLKAGEREQAAAAYAASLQLDGNQDSVRRRLAEIKSPFQIDWSLLESKSVNIYLYSFNKAELLRQTLQGLAGCRIGKARIKVLLNGCTDDSLGVVQSARQMLPDNDFQIIPLQVNVGAPAARNWLIAEPDTRTADYTVFLDDDIELQPDFLGHFLTIAAADPSIGVVGCKILFPGEPHRFQYLFRNISVAKPGVIRISLDKPNQVFDNNHYDFIRETVNVMGCCHLLSREALLDVPTFDLCFSPTQMDDIAHDIDLRLKGYKVVYTGLVGCIHHQKTGSRSSLRDDDRRLGNLLGNDVKFYYRYKSQLAQLKTLRNS